MLGACLPPTLLKGDLQQSLVYLAVRGTFFSHHRLIQKESDDEVGTLLYPRLQCHVMRDAFCGAHGIAGERTTALPASSCNLICHQPFDGCWSPSTMPLTGTSGHSTGGEDLQLLVHYYCHCQLYNIGELDSSDRPESKSPHCSSSS